MCYIYFCNKIVKIEQVQYYITSLLKRLRQMDDQLFDPKQINQSYTIAIIKPNTVLDTQKLKQILDAIENSGQLVIKNMIQRELYKEEVQNLYYKHQSKPYFDDLVAYMTSGECCVMVLTNPEGQDSGDPIAIWKKMIGSMDPEQAKKSDPESYRAKLGKSLIKNQFGGSDNQIEANKERKIFNFRIPQKPPEYSDDPYKITIKSIKQFLHPPNLEHACINERMDVMALYGPIVNWHSIEQCFCVSCKPVAREASQKIKQIQKKKILKILKEADIRNLYEQLCEKCKDHCDNYTHLVGGRQMQHILTDNEIKQLAHEVNKKQLMEMLMIEKGSTAKIMIQKIKIKQPDEIVYNMHFFDLLMQEIESDYYERYSFTELQNLILEDRRIRITYWVAKLTGKSVDRFPPVTSLDNTLTLEQLRSPKSPFFTLNRKMPLPMLIKTQQIKHVPLNFNPSIIDKPKLFQMQQNLKTQKILHRNLTKVITVGLKSESIKEAVTLLRNYNEGRHGDWDNYSGLKGNSIKGEAGGKYMEQHMKGSM